MDSVPYIRPAGYLIPADNETTAVCLQPDLDPHPHASASFASTQVRADTLARTQLAPSADSDPHYKFRQSYQRQPGMRFLHTGLVDVARAGDPNVRHGVRNSYGDRAGDVFHQLPESSLQDFQLKCAESLYHSSIHEPLGRGYLRGFKLPTETQDPAFRFGAVTKTSESAKGLIYCPTAPEVLRDKVRSGAAMDPEQYQRDLARKTMNNQSLGDEQLITRPLNRAYGWDKAAVDPKQHRFGLPSGEVDNTGANVQRALQHPLSDPAESTVLVSKRVVQHHHHAAHQLGKGRPSRGRVATLEDDPKFAFGKPNAKDEWGARECLCGDYAEQDQLPDQDLGISVRKISKLESIPVEHQQRMYGLPSIRTDRKPPKLKSIANEMNYGDESDGKGVLYPSAFAMEGVHDEDFLRIRSRDEIRVVFKTMGQEFKDHQFARICELAEKLYGGLSVDSFRHAWNRIRLEKQCSVCGASQCVHPECLPRPCAHDGEHGVGNHRRLALHQKVTVMLNKPRSA